MAEFAVFMYHPRTREDETRPEPDAETAAQLAEHDGYAQQMTDAGEMVFGRPLQGWSESVSLRAEGRTDGPYVETTETVVGFYVVEAADLDAAIAIVERNPILHQGGGVEIRPVG